MPGSANIPHLISLKRHSGQHSSAHPGREELGGKAQGLISMRETIIEINQNDFPEIVIDIPAMTVLGTSVFDAFVERNELAEVAGSDTSDERIAHAFQRGDLPFEVLGDLRSLAEHWTTPLAVRSSGLLEDTTQRPFAGVYGTKMIPNHSHNPDTRFQKLVEAIKYVWASTFFRIAKDYCRATGLDICAEKMAVIIQEIVGKRHYDRFYPDLSGVVRSFNYYPVRPARREDGVASLALGLGKTIVDGDKAWVYSPAFPKQPPPFASARELLEETQTEFWVVDLGEQREYNPIKETEYLRRENVLAAERDNILHRLASTYDLQSERLSIGTGIKGPRALTFSPLLALNEIPFNRLITQLLSRCEEACGCAVEIEFAMTFDPHRFGFLQVRPMVTPNGGMQVTVEDLRSEQALIASEAALGNGSLEDIQDIVFVRPERFDLKNTGLIARELEQHNQALTAANRPYLLIVFGRLGTLDPWLGIPLAWGQISGARVIVEATQENVKVELSQGSHYFHNIINLGVLYFSAPLASPYPIDWAWLENQMVIQSGEFTRHVRPASPLQIRVDGRTGHGVILKS